MRFAEVGYGTVTVQTKNSSSLLRRLRLPFIQGSLRAPTSCFPISDTGSGMSPEVRERIFEPLFTTKERGKGSGMGLATAYGIVPQHGGFIHVYSEPGQGTLFHVYLPAMENLAVESAPGAATQNKPKNLHGTETILLAEDHDSIRELIRRSLTRLGYQVLAAVDGRQALRLAELERPDLAVLDVVMPHMGGAASATQLLQQMPGLPILFTSGFFGEYQQRRGSGAGFSLSPETLRPDVSGKHDPRNPGKPIVGIDSSASTG
jgi:two-component system, cell cycle sensor histidine kinase and response regulator CckA